MAEIAERSPSRLSTRPFSWRQLLRTEDTWAIWIGLSLVAVAIAVFLNGGSIQWIAVAPQKWTDLAVVSCSWAAVRSGDGLCSKHDRYVSARSVCPAHAEV
jgi:hypothetical protein